MGWTVNPWLAGIVTQMRSQNKAILAQLGEQVLRKHQVIRSSPTLGIIRGGGIGRHIKQNGFLLIRDNNENFQTILY